MSEISINPKTIIGECLQTAFKLKEYGYLYKTVQQSDFEATEEFRKRFNAFFRVQKRTQQCYDKYYKLMENQKKAPLTFEGILKELYDNGNNENGFGRVEVSFSSKLMAIVDPKNPIWDQYVLKNLNLFDTWESVKSKEKDSTKRIEAAVGIYDEIKNQYAKILEDQEWKESINHFNELLPREYTLSDEKKLDFLLWMKRD